MGQSHAGDVDQRQRLGRFLAERVEALLHRALCV
jgi:hypothetical protein